MSITRRHFLTTAASGVALSFIKTPGVWASSSAFTGQNASPINIIVPRDYQPPTDDPGGEYRFKLVRATLEYLENAYSVRPLPVWDKVFSQVDLEKRVTNIVHWVMKAVKAHVSVYPMDPAWIVAQIMKESYFYEFAISRALAVGICQFIQPTAKSHDILCAGDKSAHGKPPYKQAHLAGKVQEYYRLRRERRRYAKSGKPKPELTQEKAVRLIAAGKSANYQKSAKAHLSYWKKLADYDAKVTKARDQYRQYLQANIRGKDIFNNRDLNMILNFDERFTYKKPIFAMVKMLTKALRARNGNIIAASVGFNAGLSSTRAYGAYEPYGQIPAIEQTTTYISHVLINHYEITRRME